MRDQDPHPEATPRMRRLAASMARAGATLRTLPGRPSRSLAPSGGARRRHLRDLALLLLALVPFVIAMAVMSGRGGEGSWTVSRVAPPPWQPTMAVDARTRALIGSHVDFEAGGVQAPPALACERPRYQWLRQPVARAFQGALAGRGDAQAMARSAGLAAGSIDTLRVDCANASFDFHRAGDALLILFDGALLTLTPR